MSAATVRADRGGRRGLFSALHDGQHSQKLSVYAATHLRVAHTGCHILPIVAPFRIKLKLEEIRRVLAGGRRDMRLGLYFMPGFPMRLSIPPVELAPCADD